MKLEGTDTPLPRFWKEGMMALEELQPSLITKRSISKEAALMEPIWYSHLFEVPDGLCTYKRVWENKLRLRTVGDMMAEDGTPWTEAQVRAPIMKLRRRRSGWLSGESLTRKRVRGQKVKTWNDSSIE